MSVSCITWSLGACSLQPIYDLFIIPLGYCHSVLLLFQGNFGDISSRTALRKNLKCKSFDWYIKNIYPELFIPDQALYSGEVSKADTRFIWTTTMRG